MIRAATTADLALIRDLQKKFTNQIGYIPPIATERELEAGNVHCGILNGHDAGFLLIQPHMKCQPTTAAIIQAAVYMDARRQHVGLALVTRACDDARHRGCGIIQAQCREDLEANAFWLAAGFEAIASKPGGDALGKKLIIYRQPLYPGIDITQLAIPTRPHGPGGKFCRKLSDWIPRLLRPPCPTAREAQDCVDACRPDATARTATE
jgi:N-acetylglutamate synthase-like GNAT family acetyltransferase